MAIPYSENIAWSSYISDPFWFTYVSMPAPDTAIDPQEQKARALNEIWKQAFKQPVDRGIQFLRDAARLVLKVPARSIWMPVILEKNWQQLERAKINTKLTGYSFVQLASIPAKFLVALVALASLSAYLGRAKWLLDKSDGWTAHLDGRASQLEALKEEGRKNAKSREEYDAYKNWLYTIDPTLCLKLYRR